MKKNLSSILVMSLMVLVMLFHFTGCEKLKPDNLEANYNLKQANKYYADETYRKAIESYEKALELNPELKFIYIYLGTSYSQVYRPMKDTERNKMYGEKAIEYLVKAKEHEPKREQVIIALGDLYDKMGDFEKAESYYKLILENKVDDPKSYYTLATFYNKNGKTEMAEDMYKQRIELNPEDPDGYHYYVGYLQDQRKWEECVVNYEKRLYTILDPAIIKDIREIDQLNVALNDVRDVNKFMDMVKKNKKVDKAEKERLLEESRVKLEGKPTVEEGEARIVELHKAIADKFQAAEANISTLPDEKKRMIAETYYSIGNVCWNWSYQTPPDLMAPQQRKPILEKGMSNLEKAVALSPEYPDPLSYMGLLWREMIKVEPLRRDEFVKKNEEYNKKFISIYKKKRQAEEYRKQLEQLGTENQ